MVYSRMRYPPTFHVGILSFVISRATDVHAEQLRRHAGRCASMQPRRGTTRSAPSAAASPTARTTPLRRHAGKPLDAQRDLDELWAIERGLQICVQNRLDVATHVAGAAGHDVPDHASAIDRLEELGE